MQYTVKVVLPDAHGNEQEHSHTTSDPFGVAQFITGVAAEQPGKEILFRVITEGERFPQTNNNQ